MNMEELKLIIEMINGLGEATMWGFLGFLGYKIVYLLIYIAGWLVGIWFVGKILTSIVQANTFGKEIRDMLGVGSAGALTDNECRGIIQRVQQLLLKEKENA